MTTEENSPSNTDEAFKSFMAPESTIFFTIKRPIALSCIDMGCSEAIRVGDGDGDAQVGGAHKIALARHNNCKHALTLAGLHMQCEQSTSLVIPRP